MRLLITGASGFIGRNLLRDARRHGFDARAVLRRLQENPEFADAALMPDLTERTGWRDVLTGQEAVIHCAALVHRPLAAQIAEREHYALVNTALPLRLAEEAAAAGVRHFIFLSTIGVHGSTSQDGPLTEVSPIRPESPYAETKARAEEGLLAIAQRTGLAVTIIRPVLVYGPEVKGNFASLARLVRSGMPLPLKSVRNRRAFLGIDNLTSLVLHRIMAASSGTETLIAADDERVSTPDFIRMLAAALGRRALLMPLPPDLLRATLLAMGRKATANSLLESLDVNCAVAWRLGWRPAIALQDGLHDAVRALARHPTAAPSSLAH